ncbi:peroxisome biosynthesis protein (Peroxin-10), putative [Talaromyces stipitatus ATCC 10500]|uniref:RING-type E3 ubiquitin transferase n=1 Tax=Talaromyces stipitatus (strain ATCC 10500 / CBS 375.48 / QM 6759 / NRRL 1006) TaxID=441959 RepID=B8LZE0_TALSN|nr:peroxisome biosynthesis protein (Peroxin-10), putative [Talaromyces stipitatus ATCC 10500]EED21693.1 peroxisome biosynthesis protein (Peroxin-10), putative [Talaromyces stipitatus ATCC 10500]
MTDKASDSSDIPSGASPSTTPNSAPTSHFYPFATSPDIIRSHEKDAYIISTLTNQSQSIIRSIKGARYAHGNADTIKNLTELLYFSLTTLIGNRTLGEEYCDVVQLETDTLQLPSIARRAGYIFSSIIIPWVLGRSLPSIRAKIRARLERSIARAQARAALKSTLFQTESSKTTKRKSQSLFNPLCIQEYILEHFDSLTSPSHVYALSLATFYFTGAYYHLSKRLWGLRYVFTKQIGESEQRVGYEVLGVLLVLQMTIQGIVHVRKTLQQLSQTEKPTATATVSKGGAPLFSVQNPVSIPTLTATMARYDLSENPQAISWIPEGQHQKCTLCLEPFKDPSVTTCGHVFCWICARDWAGGSSCEDFASAGLIFGIGV